MVPNTLRDQLDYKFDGIKELVSQINSSQHIPRNKPRIEEFCVMLFTNGNLNRIRKTLPQFLNLDARTIILDDSRSDRLKQIVKHVGGKPNVEYHGYKEQVMTLNEFHKISTQTQNFFCPFGRNYWTLDYCRN
jgi:hypothetical protein